MQPAALTRSASSTFAVLLLAGLVVFAGWSSDFITLQGERTVYTADCADGVWNRDYCTGRLRAGKRYRFRALKAHNEVLYWTSGATDASGKFTGCQIASGREWRCPPNGNEGGTVTLQMKAGRPVVDPQAKTLPLHAVSKLRWYLLSWGLPAGSNADGA